MADAAKRAGLHRAGDRRRHAVARRFPARRVCRAGGAVCWARPWRCQRCWNWRCRWASAVPAKRSRVWFWADSRQQLSGLSLALMALLLALAVNVGVGTMVETFSRTFVIWLDGRLGGGYLHQRHGRCAGQRDQDLAAPAARGAGDPAGRPRRNGVRRRADRNRRAARSRPPTGITGRCCNPCPLPGHASAPAMPALSASNWPDG